MLGVLAAAFWLVPGFGLAQTAAVCAGLNLLCALVALQLAPNGAAAAAPGPVRSRAAAPDGERAALAVLAATGLLGIAYEVLVVRVLSQVTEATVYTFAALLAVYLAGTALGAAAWQRWHPPLGAATAPAESSQGRSQDRSTDRLLCALAAACLLGSATLWIAEDARDALRAVLGSGMAAALLSEGALALAAFALPTAVMGALFSELTLQAQASKLGFSRALAVNTLGAAAAPPLFGVLLVPALGPKFSLLLVAAGYLALAAPRAGLTPKVWATAAAVAAVAFWAPPLAFVDVPEGGRIVSYREGALAAVSVVEDASGVSRLRINNRQQEGSSHTQLSDARQALLPLLLHPAPQRVLFLGLGTGTTARAAAADPGLQVDAVELLPEVIEASAHFAAVQAQPDAATAPARLHLLAADARRHIRSAGPAYDVIVSDNFHPARSGSGSLYTVEHFQAVQRRLAAGGLFCQWLPLHQMDLGTLRSVLRAFQQVFPGGWAMLATNSLDTPVLGLIARPGAGRFDAARLQQRLSSHRLPQAPADFGLADIYALLGGFIAGPQALARFAGDAPLNTDDHPVVAYRAPRITYAPDSLPRDRLLALLQALQITPAELLDEGTASDLAPRMAAYWAARDRFIAAGRGVRPTADVAAMLAQVREPLLAVLRTSHDFRPARDPLRRMAQALAASDPAAAQALLRELDKFEP
jgi:spermidine synthase